MTLFKYQLVCVIYTSVVYGDRKSELFASPTEGHWKNASIRAANGLIEKLKQGNPAGLNFYPLNLSSWDMEIEIFFRKNSNNIYYVEYDEYNDWYVDAEEHIEKKFPGHTRYHVYSPG